MGFWIVNFLTFLRIIGIFLIVISFYYFSGFTTAIIALICYISDFLDGFLARRFKCSTFFGSVFDTLADKLFIIVNLVLLIKITILSIIPIVIEIIIGIVQYYKYLNRIRVYSNVFGKLKMWIVGITVVLLYLTIDYQLNQLYYLLIILPLIIIELLTLFSYILYKNQNISVRKLTKKDRNFFAKKTLKEVLFDPDIYKEYYNTDSLKTIYLLVKDN